MLKTRVSTGQRWEFGLFRVGYWQQGCGRCEAPFYREASPKKKGQDTPFYRGVPVFTATPEISSKSAFLHWTNSKILQKQAKLQFSFQIEDILCERACWRLGSLRGNTGNLGFSGWDVDNRVVDVVRRHSIEKLPKKKVRTLHFIEGYTVFTATPQISSKPAFLHWRYSKILQNQAKLQFSFQIEDIQCERACWRLGSLRGNAGNLGFSGWDIDNRVVDVVGRHSKENCNLHFK